MFSPSQGLEQKQSADNSISSPAALSCPGCQILAWGMSEQVVLQGHRNTKLGSHSCFRESLNTVSILNRWERFSTRSKPGAEQCGLITQGNGQSPCCSCSQMLAPPKSCPVLPGTLEAGATGALLTYPLTWGLSGPYKSWFILIQCHKHQPWRSSCPVPITTLSQSPAPLPVPFSVLPQVVWSWLNQINTKEKEVQVLVQVLQASLLFSTYVSCII